MTLTWGTGLWGDSTWGTNSSQGAETHSNQWPFTTVVPEDDEPIHDILTVLEYASNEVQYDIDYIYTQLFLETATGRELENIAAEVGVKRKTGEDDDSLRFRTRLAKATARSNGTFPDLLNALQRVFGDDTEKLFIEPANQSPGIVIRIPSVLIENIPVSTDELETQLDRAVPNSDPVRIFTDDTLRLGESGSSGLGGKLI